MSPRHIERGALVVDEETHRHDLDAPGSPSPSGVRDVDLGGVDLALAVAVTAEAAVDAEHARDAEAPDVGVEHADGEPARGERGGEVHGDRRLADAALAARDREDPRGRRHLGVAPRSRGVEPGPLHGRGLLLWVISPYSTVTSRTPGRPRTFDSTSCWIWPRSGQPAVVSATCT